MNAATLAPILIVAACVLMMLAMHRLGGHAHRRDDHRSASLRELRRRRDELDEEIARREQGADPRTGEDLRDVGR